MFEECLENQKKIKDLFLKCSTPEAYYETIITLGRSLSPYPNEAKTASHRVEGCQSIMYLLTTEIDGKLFFKISSDALISAGLAALLLMTYNGQDPLTILSCPPSFLQELAIPTYLTPSRANGLYSIHKRLKQEALLFLVKQT